MFVCVCVKVSTFKQRVSKNPCHPCGAATGHQLAVFEVEFAPDASICIIHTDRERKMFFLQISSQGTPGTPFCVYWIRLIHTNASTASMELHDEDPVNPETWEWLEQGKDGKPMRHLDVVHPIPQISADGMIWSMRCF